MRVLAATKRGYRRRAGSIRAMTLVTAESVHRTPVLDLARVLVRGSTVRTPARPGAVWWRSAVPPGLDSVREDRALTHSTPRRHLVVGLRPPPPEPDAEAITTTCSARWIPDIARQAGGTPRGYRPPARRIPTAQRHRGPGTRRRCETLHSTNRSRPRRPVSIPPGGAMEPQREQLPSSAGHVTVAICARCGDVVVGDAGCRCTTPYDEPAFRRRHRDAVARARATASDRRRRRSSNPAA